MKKIIIMVILLVLGTAAAYAQHKVDFITLRNGNVLKGDIVSRDSSSVFFKSADGSLSKKISSDEIASMSVKDLSAMQYRNIGGDVKRVYTPSSRTVGYGAFVEFLAGTGTMYPLWTDLTTSQGYFINPDIFVGAGTGVNMKLVYDWTGYEGTLRRTSMSLPLFATARYYFMNNRKCSPYIDGKIGYAFPIYDALDATGDNFDGKDIYQAIRTNGVYFNISFGVELNRITAALGLTGASTQQISFYEDTGRSFHNGLSHRWNRYSQMDSYMDVALYIGIGYRF